MMSDGHADGMESVVKLKRRLSDAVQQEKESHILKILNRLSHISMTLEILQATHIGKEVNGLRKLGGQVGEKAKSLVKKWKKLVPSPPPTNHQPRTDEISDHNNSLPQVTHHQHSSGRVHSRVPMEEEGGFAQALQFTPVVSHKPSKDAKHHHTSSASKSGHGHRSERPKHKREGTEKRETTRTEHFKDRLSAEMNSTHERRSKSPAMNIHSSLPIESKTSSPVLHNEEVPPTQNNNNINRKRKATFESSLDAVSLSKRSRTQIYSGKKKSVTGPQVVPSLFDLSMRILMDNIDAIDEVGGVPYLVLEPVLQKCTPSQLMRLEEFNPHFLEDTDVLWEKHTQKLFRGSLPKGEQTWRELYIEKQEQQEEKLKNLAASIKEKEKARKEPVRTTKLAAPTRVPARRRGGGSVPVFIPGGGRRSFEKPATHSSPLMKQTMKMAKQRNHMMTFKPSKR